MNLLIIDIYLYSCKLMSWWQIYIEVFQVPSINIIFAHLVGYLQVFVEQSLSYAYWKAWCTSCNCKLFMKILFDRDKFFSMFRLCIMVLIISSRFHSLPIIWYFSSLIFHFSWIFLLDFFYRTTGNGNCLFNACSLALVGDESVFLFTWTYCNRAVYEC